MRKRLSKIIIVLSCVFVSHTAAGYAMPAPVDCTPYTYSGDGRIDGADAVFGALRLWQDTNHNGFSESSELHTIQELRVYAVDLNYKESKHADQYGNQFRYRAKVYDGNGSHMGRWAWDVFFVKP